MNFRIFIITCLLILSASVSGQSDPGINQTDKQGKKQGHWIKKYPNEKIMYEGYFKDDHPVGELKRYNEDKSLKSVLNYSADGRNAAASIYHPNGYIAAKGNYIDQKKDGKWQFFSDYIDKYLISEELYNSNRRNGLSVKYYPDSTIAETLIYVNDLKHGEWTQYYPSGTLKLRSYYTKGKLSGKFEAWYEDGKPEFSGRYKDDLRDGHWLIYNKDGSVKYELTYQSGITNDRQLDIDESARLDSLENNRGKIADPEKTGIIR